MNKELEEATKKLRAACVDFTREAIKATGDGTIAALMLAKAIEEIVGSFTDADFPEMTKKGGAQ